MKLYFVIPEVILHKQDASDNKVIKLKWALNMLLG